MSRLTNIREEAFCQLVELCGWSVTDSYEGVGFSRDRANSSKYGDREAIAGRRRELRAERETAAGATGEESLRKILQGALQAGEWAPAATAARLIAEGDGSLAKLDVGRAMTVREILVEAGKIDGIIALRVGYVMGLLNEDGTPAAPWTDGNFRPVCPFIDEQSKPRKAARSSKRKGPGADWRPRRGRVARPLRCGALENHPPSRRPQIVTVGAREIGACPSP